MIIYSCCLADIPVVYLQRGINVFSFKHNQVENAHKRFDSILFGFFLKFKLKEEFCQGLGYVLFPTRVKLFLSSLSFKALMVVNSFRNRERLGTKPKLRTWERESSQESTGSLSAVGRRRSAILSLSCRRIFFKEEIFSRRGQVLFSA